MTSNLNKSLFILFLVVATELIGFGLIIPVLPVIAKNYDLNYFFLGFLMASFSMAQFIASPILGSLSDRFGRKPVLIFSKLGTVLSYLLLAYANNYWMFLCARLFDGFTGGNIAVARAYVADITDKHSRAKGMAVIGISFGIGFIIGPILGGLLYRGLSGQFVAAIVAGSLSLIAMLLTVFFLKEPVVHKPAKTFWNNLSEGIEVCKRGPVMLILATYLFYMVVFSGFETTFSVFLNYVFLMNLNQISWMFVFTGVIGLFVQGYLSQKASSNYQKFTLLGILCLSLSFMGLSFVEGFYFLLFFLSFFAASISIVSVFMPSLLTSFTDEDTVGAVMGMYEGVGSLGRILGPLLAYSFPLTFIRDQYFYYGVFLLFLFLCFVLVSRRLMLRYKVN